MKCEMSYYQPPRESDKCTNYAGPDKWLIPLCTKCAMRNKQSFDTTTQELRRMSGLPASKAYMKRLRDPFYIIAKSEEKAFMRDLTGGN